MYTCYSFQKTFDQEHITSYMSYLPIHMLMRPFPVAHGRFTTITLIRKTEQEATKFSQHCTIHSLRLQTCVYVCVWWWCVE